MQQAEQRQETKAHQPALRMRRTAVSVERGPVKLLAAIAGLVLAYGLLQVFVVDVGALGTVAGGLLIGLVPSLARGYRRAQLLAIGLLAVVVPLSWNDPDLRMVAIGAGLVLLVVLAMCSRSYNVSANPQTRAVFAAGSLLTVAGLADISEGGGLLHHPVLITVIFGGAAAVIYGLRPGRAHSVTPAADRARAARLVAERGADTLAAFAMRDDKRYMFSPGDHAFLAYRVELGVALVTGDPVGDPHAFRELLVQFETAVRRRGWRPAAIGVSADLVELWREHGYHAHYTGDEAIVDPAKFTLEGRVIRKVRQSVNRLHGAGWTFQMLRSDELPRELAGNLTTIAEHWRDGKPETGFSMSFASVEPQFDRLDMYAVAFDPAGQPGGFLHWGYLPANGSLSLSSMRRLEDTPNGLNEYLICQSLAWARDAGSRAVSLNFAAFAGILAPDAAADWVTNLEQRVLRLLARRFQLTRLRDFNSKFQPSWNPRYIVYPSTAALPRVALASMICESYITLPWRMKR